MKLYMLGILHGDSDFAFEIHYSTMRKKPTSVYQMCTYTHLNVYTNYKLSVCKLLKVLFQNYCITTCTCTHKTKESVILKLKCLFCYGLFCMNRNKLTNLWSSTRKHQRQQRGSEKWNSCANMNSVMYRTEVKVSAFLYCIITQKAYENISLSFGRQKLN